MNIFCASFQIIMRGYDLALLLNSVPIIGIVRYLFIRFFCFQMLMSLLMLISGDVYKLITYCTFVESFFTTLSAAAVLWLRWKKPELKRPIKV